MELKMPVTSDYLYRYEVLTVRQMEGNGCMGDSSNPITKNRPSWLLPLGSHVLTVQQKLLKKLKIGCAVSGDCSRAVVGVIEGSLLGRLLFSLWEASRCHMQTSCTQKYQALWVT